MRNLDSEQAYFVIALGKSFAAEVSRGVPLPDSAIETCVRTGPFQLTNDEADFLIRRLEQSFTTAQSRGASVVSDFKPWLRTKRGDIDFYYWTRLRRYYLEGAVLPPPVVATLDSDTDEILDYSGDPTDQHGNRRGMVMGHVQSGKTTNYSALICKAADAGYRVIILLAGITNSLRSQTQERLDETFIGKKSLFQPLAQEPLPLQTYAPLKRFPAYGTTRDKDYTQDAAGVFFSLAAHNEPTIFVTKKNQKTLSLLHEWLSGKQGQGGKLSIPLLLIDDEADNASINTAKDPKATTAINTVIRQILGLFERSSYIGYTATPFANIFVDPDTEDEMRGDDLFPRHFIKALDPPSNYVGSARVFHEDGDLRTSMVRTVNDYAKVLPLKHKSDAKLSELPGSLHKAIRLFVLSRAIRVLRGHGSKHCSMMINVSRFNAIQEKVLGLVYSYLEMVKASATVSAGLPKSEALRDPLIFAMARDFDSEYEQCGFSFEQVASVLKASVGSIVVKTVNMRGGTLDYSRQKEEGLHVIAIGGLALSRGLTLEGLSTSYILRNTAASDTLMQMARWFGYRPDYEDLCRVYLPQGSLDHYVNVHEAIEELRDEVKRMEKAGLTPADFGLKVRQSPTAIKITAANKMRSATEMTVAQDYSRRHLEGYVLANDDAANILNLEAVANFLAQLPQPSSSLTRNALLWKDVAGLSVRQLLEAFKFPDAHRDLGKITGKRSLFSDYFDDRIKTEFGFWDVALPHLQKGTPAAFCNNLQIALRERAVGDVSEAGYRITGQKNRVADPNDAQLGLTPEQIAAGKAEKEVPLGLRGDKAFCAQRNRPLLIIHAFTTGKKVEGLKILDPVVSLSFCLPGTNKPATARKYQVNAVYRRQVQAEVASEADDDESLINDQ